MTALKNRAGPEQLSPVNVREAANILHSMAHDYLLAIESTQKAAAAAGGKADVRDMQRKRQACLVAHRLLLLMLGVSP